MSWNRRSHSGKVRTWVLFPALPFELGDLRQVPSPSEPHTPHPKNVGNTSCKAAEEVRQDKWAEHPVHGRSQMLGSCYYQESVPMGLSFCRAVKLQ